MQLRANAEAFALQVDTHRSRPKTPRTQTSSGAHHANSKRGARRCCLRRAQRRRCTPWNFSSSGFSTAAYAQTDTDEAQVGYIGQPEGIDSEGSWAIDSKLGLQITARFNDVVSATVQGVGYADLTADWEPHLDWAYVRVQPTRSLSTRIGYMRAPTFMFSDSVFVGYANSWVRPPLEVYNLSPAYQLRGIDATWRDAVGPVTVSINPYFGDSEIKVGASETTLDVDQWAGLVVTGEYKSFMGRVGFSRIDLGTSSPEVVGLLASLRSPQVAAICGSACAVEADHTDLARMDMETLDIGGQYDDGANVAIVEYAQRRSGNYVVVDMHSAYATYGRRFGGFMPYVTFAMTRRDEADRRHCDSGRWPVRFCPRAARGRCNSDARRRQ